jgi:hypothetical protein
MWPWPASMGLSKFKGKKHDILSMAIMYPNLLQMVTLKSSGITDIKQVKGRSISTGSPGSGTNFMAEAVLKALGIAPDSYKDSRLSFTESANALRDGTIDVGIWSVGPGTSSILDLATTHEITCSDFTPEQTEQILAANKTYSSVELAGGVYRGIDKPCHHRGVERDDLPGVTGYRHGLQAGQGPFRTQRLPAEDSSIGRLHHAGKRGEVLADSAAPGDHQIPGGKGHRRAG